MTLPRSFFERDADVVARELLGTTLVHESTEGRTAGRIVEVEAYLPDDEASHSFRGETARNASMFARGGTGYVYLIYGMHLCFNVVTGRAGSGQAVLVRALEPTEGLDLMRARRGVEEPRALCSGPGKLSRAMAIDRGLDGCDLLRGALRLTGRPLREGAGVAASPRIGIRKAAERELRFCLTDSAFLSRRA